MLYGGKESTLLLYAALLSKDSHNAVNDSLALNGDNGNQQSQYSKALWSNGYDVCFTWLKSLKVPGSIPGRVIFCSLFPQLDTNQMVRG